MPTVAYSYARFSSVAQSDGDSERRQLEDARHYAAEKGFTLDESLGVDRGLPVSPARISPPECSANSCDRPGPEKLPKAPS